MSQSYAVRSEYVNSSAASLFCDRNPNLCKNFKRCPIRKILLGLADEARRNTTENFLQESRLLQAAKYRHILKKIQSLKERCLCRRYKIQTLDKKSRQFHL
jgi:hypothetical protein